MSLVVAACGGASQGPPVEVSKIKYTHTTCDDCGIEPAEEPQYRPPDEDAPGGNSTADAASCWLAAQAMVAVELGNYAQPEERDPAIDRAERRCRAAKLSRDDVACLADARDQASLAYCAPALYPDVPVQVVTAEQCDAAAKNMRVNLESQIAGYSTEASIPLMRQHLAAIESCKRDRWNHAMLQCAQAYVPLYAQYCAYVQPASIWTRLAARLEKAGKG